MPDIIEKNVSSWEEAQSYLESQRTSKSSSSSPLPIVFKNINLGPCTENWSDLSYLKEKLGNKQIVIHKSDKNETLNFVEKNFKYEKIMFDEFLDLLGEQSCSSNPNQVTYLRSTSTKNFRKDTANINVDFPEISNDIILNNSKSCHTFSTIFRVSSNNTQIWNHYDTINNFLMQIVGCKEVFLSPPSAATYLKLKTNSDKPDVFDPWASNEADQENIPEKYIYKYCLQPGDVLFLPSHWFHATRVVQQKSKFSISVNHFWKQLNDPKNEFYDKKDIYGNKPPKPAQEIELLSLKINKLLEKLPNEDIKEFYRLKAERMIEGSDYF